MAEIRDTSLSVPTRAGRRASANLPSGTELAKCCGVARMTVELATRTLRDERLVVSRQGSTVFVRQRSARTIGLSATTLD
jgi:DNA-binding GntR family transcriptional regulator